MPTIEGPYRTLRTDDGHAVPWYVLPFDERGRCKAPRTRAHLLKLLRDGGFTRILLFSHGWNNDWEAASERYADFVKVFAELRQSLSIPIPVDYRPLLVGVFWPSTSLVLPWERGPRFAAAATEDRVRDAFADDLNRSIDALTADLSEAHVRRFYELADSYDLDVDGVRELARLLAPTLGADDELGAEIEDPDELAEAWLAGARALAEQEGGTDEEDEEFGTATPIPSHEDPQTAGLLSGLDPRHALRMATVWKMKDRAGTVGAKGVHALLGDIFEASAASVHLVGHSYGCKVMLSAVAAGDLPRPVSSVLLLQPAISHRAFAVDADGKGSPGGYRVALARIAQPIVSTYSNKDFPLHKTFHLAVRRKSDLGEMRIAAGPPSRFAALGGYGPAGMASGEVLTVEIRDSGHPYDELGQAGLELLAVNGSRSIRGHGDIVQAVTAWALYEQIARATPNT